MNLNKTERKVFNMFKNLKPIDTKYHKTTEFHDGVKMINFEALDNEDGLFLYFTIDKDKKLTGVGFWHYLEGVAVRENIFLSKNKELKEYFDILWEEYKKHFKLRIRLLVR